MRSVFAAAVILFSAQAMATPVTLDFTGTMSTYYTAADSSLWTPAIESLSDKSVSGSITFDLDLLLPTTSGESPGEFGFQIFRQQDMPAGTVVSASVNWAGGTFIPTGAPNTGADLVYAENPADPLSQDGVQIADAFSRSQDGVEYIQQASVSFQGPLFGNGPVLIPTLAELANLGFLSAPNISGSIINYSYRPDPTDPDDVLISGYTGDFRVTSLSVRPTAVPEPGPLALMSLAVMGLVMMRRVTARGAR